MKAHLDLNENGSENVKYDYDGYFAYIRKSPLSIWPNYSADSHWHDDLEFIYILSGYMDYNINGEILRLHTGQGLMVNAKQLHYGYSTEQKECEFICILLHPILISPTPTFDLEFVSSLLENESIPYILFDPTYPWQKEILIDLETMYQHKDSPTAPLHLQYLFSHIWFLIATNLLPQKSKAKKDRNLPILKSMLSYIQNNYDTKISLEDISKSGNVSKSTCLTIFKKYLKDTPTNYLNGYRLKIATKLLTTTTMSISEIAFSVGFQGVSYFTETFHKYYGCSPREYRNKTSKPD